ncbi:hypothetical protein GQ53DRAFT_670949 [Thozetella sp. PMI_491]|nr:hypothetical protein GQ53DRAFT_670949 [Thozetella sp. PMI_491]
MREFMHHITNSFFAATDWNEDNSYKELNATARELIDFDLPKGIRLSLSSLATPHFATSYNLGTVGVVDGSISYLFSSLPLRGIAAKSDEIPLPALLRSYRQLHELTSREHWPAATVARAIGEDGQRIEVKDDRKYKSTLLYGRLYLPLSMLEGLVVKRLSPALQVRLSAVSAQSLRDGGTLLGLVEYDKGKYGVEGLASTDGGFLGIRGLYNFGGDASQSNAAAPPKAGEENGHAGERERIYGRFSAGGELYYGTLNKSGGVSLGMRFATLPSHRGSPLAATLTINPLMGNISATYAVLARQYCSLATRMEFNVYSYESEWAVGMELWSRRKPAGFLLGAEEDGTAKPSGEVQQPKWRTRSFEAKMEWRLDPDPVVEEPARTEGQDYLGVVKARLDQNFRVGLLWEGRLKSLIFSLGTGIDLQKLGEPFRSLGLELQYSS